MLNKPKFRIEKRIAGEFGNKSFTYIIQVKKVFLWWDLDIHFLDEDYANQYSDKLNEEYYKYKLVKKYIFK